MANWIFRKIIKNKVRSGIDLNDFTLWKVNSPEYYWWNKAAIQIKKRQEKSMKDADAGEVISLGGDDSYMSYKNMDKIEEEQNQYMGQGYTANVLNSSAIIRTNSKISQNTNSGSNKGTNREGAKNMMRAVLKKKSTMLFVQESKETGAQEDPGKPKQSNSPANKISSGFARRGTLMPDFKSSLLNRSSQFKKQLESGNKKPKKEDSSINIGLKKFKTIREQPVTIQINGLEIKNNEKNKPKDTNDTNRLMHPLNVSSKSGRKSPMDDFDDIGSFKSAGDEDAIEMKGSNSSNNMTAVLNNNKPQNFTDVLKKVTIMEVSEEKEFGDVVSYEKSPVINSPAAKHKKNEFSKITEDLKEAEDGEGIDFESDQD